jgi:uncharacterized protein (DUF4415 family)
VKQISITPKLNTKPTRDNPIKLTKEHPEAELRHVMRGVVRQGLKPVLPKEAISLRVDKDVLDWYRENGTGYQTRMNAVLRAFRDATLHG